MTSVKDIKPKTRRFCHGLLVEEGTGDSGHLRRQLDSAPDFAFDCAYSADVALRRVRDLSFDIVVVEVAQWSAAVLERMHQLRRHLNKVPMILVLRSIQEDVPHEVAQVGFDACVLMSSFSKRRLHQCVDEAHLSKAEETDVRSVPLK